MEGGNVRGPWRLGAERGVGLGAVVWLRDEAHVARLVTADVKNLACMEQRWTQAFRHGTALLWAHRKRTRAAVVRTFRKELSIMRSGGGSTGMMVAMRQLRW